MLKPITRCVWVHESSSMQTNTTIIKGDDGILLVDPGLTRDEMSSIAEDLDRLDLKVSVGFSTHPHWDHVLWDAAFGDVPRYCTVAAANLLQAQLSNPDWKAEEEAGLPEEIAGEVPLDNLFGRLTALPANASSLPWGKPEIHIIQHAGHAPGHAALLIKDQGVLIAGDMLSDVFIPMINVSAEQPINDYLDALRRFEDILDNVKFVIPGHGSVGEGDEVHKRLQQDRAYVEALQDGRDVDDERVKLPKEGWDWVAGIHEWQVQTLAKK